MVMLAHFDLELYEMDVRSAFLNSDFSDDVYIVQPLGFEVAGKEDMIYKLEKSIYGLN